MNLSSGSQQKKLNIALIGYGKMGKAIEEIAVQRGHAVTLKIDINSMDLFTNENLQQCDVAIEFTSPHSAVENIITCLRAGIPVVSGSTGWLNRWEEVKNVCIETKGTLLYASNYSVGVNIFFEVNKYDLRSVSSAELNNLAELMKKNPTLKIEVSGHTDNSGSEIDNKVLSEK